MTEFLSSLRNDMIIMRAGIANMKSDVKLKFVRKHVWVLISSNKKPFCKLSPVVKNYTYDR